MKNESLIFSSLIPKILNATHLLYLTVVFVLGSFSLHAQDFQQFFPPFIQQGQTLAEATAGGLSAPQFSEIDLNNDGIQDLFIYDKMGGLGLTFLNGGTPNQVDYHYAPEYQSNFPSLSEWALLRDYNGDGIQDIFAFSSIPGIPGIEVYTGYYNAQNQIAFRQNELNGGEFNIIYYPGNSGFNNLYVSAIDIPAIDDIDMDGDLDVVTFNVAGGIVEFFSNQSIERGFGKDSLLFVLEDRCWGKFYESGLAKEVDLSDDPEVCFLNFRASEPRNGVHAGSTLLTIDLDNDGDKEVILGDVSFTNLNLVINGGNAEQAFMTSQDVNFPSYDVAVDVPIFPAAYSLDVDNDSVKDLLVSPNLSNDIGETYAVAWFYKNTGTNELPVYKFQQKDLLVNQMLDFGTGAQPVFVDYNQDGLQDLVVGNKGFFVPGGNRNARVFLYENVGTASEPVFQLKNDDLFNLNVFSQNSWRFTPTFGDLDGDGDLDALIGEEFGNLFYAENRAGAGQPMEFKPAVFAYQAIDVGQSSRPQIIDMNRDGLLDLVIGERNGNLNYFINTGTPENPIFTADPTNNFFGKVDARIMGQVTGYSVPVVIEMDGIYQLFVGNEGGQLLKYETIEGNLDGTFNKVATKFGNFEVGREIHPTFADINQDGFLEMAVGNFRGGLSFFYTDLKSSTAISLPLTTFKITPNPTTVLLNIDLPKHTFKATHVTIYTVSGQEVQQHPFNQTVNVTHLPQGMYLLEIQTDKGKLVQKFVKQ